MVWFSINNEHGQIELIQGPQYANLYELQTEFNRLPMPRQKSLSNFAEWLTMHKGFELPPITRRHFYSPGA